MKKVKNLLCASIIAIALFMMPTLVQAKGVVTIYFFRGETCQYCKRANAFFESLKEDNDYKDKFVIRDWEVWNNTDNAALMKKVAAVMGDTVSGVPYFIIGNKSWNGYTTDYDDEIKAQINATYDDDSFVDKVVDVVGEDTSITTSKKDYSALIAISIIVVVIALLVLTIHFARKDVESTDDIDEPKAKKIAVEEEPKKEEVVKEEKETPVKKASKAKTAKKTKSKSKKKTSTKKSSKK